MADNGSMLKGRHDLHLVRKLWHAAMGLMMVYVYAFLMSREQALKTLGLAFCVIFFAELVRLRSPAINEWLTRGARHIMRQCERHRLSGTPYYIASVFLAILIFPKPLALLAILLLAIGDPVASFFGVLWGDKSVRFSNGKSLVGTVAGIVACYVSMTIGVWLLSERGILPRYSDFQVAVCSFLGALAGGTAELLPIEIDDNFTIPLVVGFTLWLIFAITGWNFYLNPM